VRCIRSEIIDEILNNFIYLIDDPIDKIYEIAHSSDAADTLLVGQLQA